MWRWKFGEIPNLNLSNLIQWAKNWKLLVELLFLSAVWVWLNLNLNLNITWTVKLCSFLHKLKFTNGPYILYYPFIIGGSLVTEPFHHILTIPITNPINNNHICAEINQRQISNLFSKFYFSQLLTLFIHVIRRNLLREYFYLLFAYLIFLNLYL